MKLFFSLCYFVILITASGQLCEKKVFHFRSGGHHLNSEKRAQIDSMMQILHPDSTYLIEIQGHTDKHGSDEKNIRLSEKRVKSVKDYVLEQRDSNIVFFARGHGEKRLISDRSKDNRRVVLYALPINKDHTLFLKSNGQVKIELKVPVEYFSYCGVCDSFPRIKKVVERFGSDYKVDIEIDNVCFTGRDSVFKANTRCISAEYRIPLQYYKEFGEVKVPKRIYLDCIGRVHKGDSISIKDNNRFMARIDTVTNEYVVTRTCYNMQPMRCCFRKYCKHYEFRFPGQYKDKITAFTIARGKPFTDSIAIVQDTNRFNFDYCVGLKDKIWGYGLFYSEPLFFEAGINSLPYRIQYYDTKNIYDLNYGSYKRHIYTIPYDLYKPLTYNDSTLRVKIRKKFNCQEVGYYLEPFDYFVPIDSINPRKFEKEWLDFPFSIRVKIDNQYYVYKPKELKRRFKKWKKIVKVKVKKKNLIKAFELDSSFIFKME